MRALIFLILMAVVSSALPPSSKAVVDLELGDSPREVIAKMTRLGAVDVTGKTRFVLTEARTGEQKTCWWLLPDSTVVGVLLAGTTQERLRVATVEIGD